MFSRLLLKWILNGSFSYDVTNSSRPSGLRGGSWTERKNNKNVFRHSSASAVIFFTHCTVVVKFGVFIFIRLVGQFLRHQHLGVVRIENAEARQEATSLFRLRVEHMRKYRDTRSSHLLTLARDRPILPGTHRITTVPLGRFRRMRLRLEIGSRSLPDVVIDCRWFCCEVVASCHRQRLWRVEVRPRFETERNDSCKK